MFEKKETVCFSVSGMHCAHCSARVQKQLLSLKGVRHVEVSLEQGTAQVTYLASKISPDEMKQSLREIGFMQEDA